MATLANEIPPNGNPAAAYNRVPRVTADFWLVKLMAVTVGETAADFLADNLGLGLTTTSWIMSAVLVAALGLAVRAAEIRSVGLLARRCTDQRRRHADHRQSGR